jgi:hypothetical protein
MWTDLSFGLGCEARGRFGRGRRSRGTQMVTRSCGASRTPTSHMLTVCARFSCEFVVAVALACSLIIGFLDSYLLHATRLLIHIISFPIRQEQLR